MKNIVTHEVYKLCLSILLIFLFLLSYTHAAGKLNSCFPTEPVTLTIGERSEVPCSCNEAVALYWYRGNKTAAVRPFIYLHKSRKYGPGYSSGEYDINENGSLIITGVFTEQSGYYTVLITIPGLEEPLLESFKLEVVDPWNHIDDEGEVTTTPEFTPSVTTNNGGGDERKNGHDTVTKSDHNDRQESYVEMDDFRSLQHGIKRVEKLCRSTVALLVIFLLVIILFCIRCYIFKCAKNSKSENRRTHSELKEILLSCPGRYESSCNDNTTKHDTLNDSRCVNTV